MSCITNSMFEKATLQCSQLCHPQWGRGCRSSACTGTLTQPGDVSCLPAPCTLSGPGSMLGVQLWRMQLEAQALCAQLGCQISPADLSAHTLVPQIGPWASTASCRGGGSTWAPIRPR